VDVDDRLCRRLGSCTVIGIDGIGNLVPVPPMWGRIGDPAVARWWTAADRRMRACSSLVPEPNSCWRPQAGAPNLLLRTRDAAAQEKKS